MITNVILGRVQDTKSTLKNQLYFYTLVMINQKLKI